MPITYPYAMPTTPGIMEIDWQPRSAVSAASSPFTYQTQVQAHPGQLLEATVQLPPMNRTQAERWIAWVKALNLTEGTFLLGDPDAPAPKGVATGTPVVDGAGQSGKTLAIRGLTANVTNIFKAGDKIQLGTGLTARLYEILQDTNTDALGKCTVDIWPRHRYSPADGAAIVTATPKGLFRLSGDPGWKVDKRHIYNFSFSVREAL